MLHNFAFPGVMMLTSTPPTAMTNMSIVAAATPFFLAFVTAVAI